MKLSSDRCGSNYRNCVYISSYGIVVVGTIKYSLVVVDNTMSYHIK